VVIYLGRLLPDASSGTLKAEPVKSQPSLLGLAPNRGLPGQHLSMLPVRSYRTLAPLLVEAENRLPVSGMFLWHSPHGRPHWALPSKFDFLGARTFLRYSKAAI